MSVSNKDEQPDTREPRKQVTMENEEEFKVNTGNDIDDDDEHWYELRVDGKQPERRANHTSFVVGSKMYIYGGYDMREGPMASTWCFDFKTVGELKDSDLNVHKLPTMTWQPVQTQGVKRPGKFTYLLGNNQFRLNFGPH